MSNLIPDVVRKAFLMLEGGEERSSGEEEAKLDIFSMQEEEVSWSLSVFISREK